MQGGYNRALAMKRLYSGVQTASGGSVPAAAPASYPQFRSVSKARPEGVNTFTATEPAGAVENDILFALIFLQNEAEMTTVPAGWTELFDIDDDTYSGVRCYLYWIRRGGSAPGLIWAWTGDTTTNWVITAWSGAVTSGDPYSASAAVTPMVQHNPNNPNCPSVNTGVDTTTVIAFGVGYTGPTDLWSAPSGYTIRHDGTTAYDCAIASKEVASAGVEDPGAFTGGQASLQVCFEMTVALKP